MSGMTMMSLIISHQTIGSSLDCRAGNTDRKQQIGIKDKTHKQQDVELTKKKERKKERM